MKRLGFLMVSAAVTAACGGGEASSPPTSPVATSSATANGTSGTSSSDGSKTGTTTRAEGITGTISGFAGTCPNVTFKVEGKVVRTDAATTYVEKGCADLKDGVRVGVAGATQGDGSLLARQVKFAPPPPPAPTLTEGTVSGRTGACPAITILLGAKVAVTSAATVFTGKTCADVKVGSKVGIYGTIAAGATTLTATKVVFR